jgi:hypothetical protein
MSRPSRSRRRRASATRTTKCAAVGHARQRVLGRDRAELLLESATVAQVDDLDDGVQRRPVVVPHEGGHAWV